MKTSREIIIGLEFRLGELKDTYELMFDLPDTTQLGLSFYENRIEELETLLNWIKGG